MITSSPLESGGWQIAPYLPGISRARLARFRAHTAGRHDRFVPYFILAAAIQWVRQPRFQQYLSETARTRAPARALRNVAAASVPTIGRFFTEEELRRRDKVVVLGTTVIQNLFGDADPMGATIKINRINFKVIGILPHKGATGFRDQDDVAVIPVTTAMYRVMGKQYVDTIDAEVRDASLIDKAQDTISQVVIKRHNLSKDKQDTFSIRNMADIQATLQSTTKTMTWLLGSIAAISLLVGGIGIMNIMLVSVSERTREIGLRKAIGARKMDIMTQFLIEAVLMTMAGGITGIICGAGMSFLLALLAGWATKLSVFAIVLATTFSILVGVGFGLWPARQAAQLNPIEALRYE